MKKLICNKIILKNGVRVIVQEMPQAFSVTTGIWVATGSAFESEKEAGVSHFLEHMLFKGTKTRTAKEIAEIMEDVGGQMNAFTSKEHTCYYVKSLTDYFSLGLDVLTDMFFNSTFLHAEFDKEKQVILEEISMYEDTPEDLVGENFMQKMWQDHIYGTPVIGSNTSVSAMTQEEMVAYYKKTYTAKNIVVVVAGNVKTDDVVREVEGYFSEVEGVWEKPVLGEASAFAGKIYTYKDIEQTHITFGFPTICGSDDNVPKLQVLSSVLGGGVTSRLFQEAREERGLSYSIYATPALLVSAGNLHAYASTNPQKVEEMLQVMAGEMMKLAESGISEQELNRAKAQLKCGLLMGLENTANVMARLGKMEANYNEIRSVEETVARIDAVEKEDVQKMAQDIFVPEKLVLSLVGSADYEGDLMKLF